MGSKKSSQGGKLVAPSHFGGATAVVGTCAAGVFCAVLLVRSLGHKEGPSADELNSPSVERVSPKQLTKTGAPPTKGGAKQSSPLDSPPAEDRELKAKISKGNGAVPVGSQNLQGYGQHLERDRLQKKRLNPLTEPEKKNIRNLMTMLFHSGRPNLNSDDLVDGIVGDGQQGRRPVSARELLEVWDGRFELSFWVEPQKRPQIGTDRVRMTSLHMGNFGKEHPGPLGGTMKDLDVQYRNFGIYRSRENGSEDRGDKLEYLEHLSFKIKPASDSLDVAINYASQKFGVKDQDLIRCDDNSGGTSGRSVVEEVDCECNAREDHSCQAWSKSLPGRPGGPLRTYTIRVDQKSSRTITEDGDSLGNSNHRNDDGLVEFTVELPPDS